MRRKLFIAAWLVFPIVLLAFHYGPGQQNASRDRSAQALTEARAAESNLDWAKACQAYDQAIAALPASDRAHRHRLQLAKAKARVWKGELPEAMGDLDQLLTEVEQPGNASAVEQEIRSELASVQYYASWLMRLEGASADEWTKECEISRQHYRLLAEENQRAGRGVQAAEYEKNLEAVIRFARMDLSELQALPLPKQCQGCKNCSQKCRSQRQSKCDKPGDKQPKDARGASQGKRPDGSGS